MFQYCRMAFVALVCVSLEDPFYGNRHNFMFCGFVNVFSFFSFLFLLFVRTQNARLSFNHIPILQKGIDANENGHNFFSFFFFFIFTLHGGARISTIAYIIRNVLTFYSMDLGKCFFSFLCIWAHIKSIFHRENCGKSFSPSNPHTCIHTHMNRNE